VTRGRWPEGSELRILLVDELERLILTILERSPNLKQEE